MRRFELKEANRNLALTAGLLLISHCLALAVCGRADLRLPKRGKIRLSDRAKRNVGLLAQGKSDFEVIGGFRRDWSFQVALGSCQVPGSVWLLRRAEAPITAENGFICFDFDTFVMDNSGTMKGWVGRTY